MTYRTLYIIAAVLFIVGIKRLGKVKTARSGNQIAAIGMLLATIGVLWQGWGGLNWWMLIPALAIGTGIGMRLATAIPMTAMPELVAAFNGLGGGASALVAIAVISSYGHAGATWSDTVSIALSIIIGIATLTGSGVAYMKLAGKKVSHPVGPAMRNQFHVALVIAMIAVAAWLGTASGTTGLTIAVIVLTAIAAGVGVFLVTPIGGADMPVVVALLNSCSGLAAASSGFVIGNHVLIVSGALVGASGLILTRIMCKAMNRSLGNVLIGGISDDSVAEDAREYNNIKEAGAEEVAMLFDAASSVIFVPGYGLAVAQAQHTVRELAAELEKRGVDVKYAIHPVAGRMPGHMNVLLAEADVPYEQLYELDHINSDFQNCDVAIVLGANDVVNPIAREEGNPISGMPILDVDHSQTVVVIKRSLSPGYAGIRNPLFDNDNTLMLFADAKQALQDMVKEVKEL